jgi:hypothetical protein
MVRTEATTPLPACSGHIQGGHKQESGGTSKIVEAQGAWYAVASGCTYGRAATPAGVSTGGTALGNLVLECNPLPNHRVHPPARPTSTAHIEGAALVWLHMVAMVGDGGAAVVAAPSKARAACHQIVWSGKGRVGLQEVEGLRDRRLVPTPNL